jgi:hypothetical protein
MNSEKPTQDQAKASPIRLEDLLPRDNVKGGAPRQRVIFGMLNRLRGEPDKGSNKKA